MATWWWWTLALGRPPIPCWSQARSQPPQTSQPVLAWADQLDTLDDFLPFSPGLPLTDVSQAAAPTLTDAGTGSGPAYSGPAHSGPSSQPSPGPSVTIGPVSKAKTKGGVPPKTPPVKAMPVQPQPANTQVPQPAGQPSAKAPTVLRSHRQPLPQSCSSRSRSRLRCSPLRCHSPQQTHPADRPHRRQRGQPGTRDVQPVTGELQTAGAQPATPAAHSAFYSRSSLPERFSERARRLQQRDLLRPPDGGRRERIPAPHSPLQPRLPTAVSGTRPAPTSLTQTAWAPARGLLPMPLPSLPHAGMLQVIDFDQTRRRLAHSSRVSSVP